LRARGKKIVDFSIFLFSKLLIFEKRHGKRGKLRMHRQGKPPKFRWNLQRFCALRGSPALKLGGLSAMRKLGRFDRIFRTIDPIGRSGEKNSQELFGIPLPGCLLWSGVEPRDAWMNQRRAGRVQEKGFVLAGQHSLV
jgi:hypothetical protein